MIKHAIRESLAEAASLVSSLLKMPDFLEEIENIAQVCFKALHAGKTLFACGNGGSHCDAMHLAEELTGRYRENRPPFAAIAIADAAHLSCVANDFGYDQVFSRYIEGVGRPGDLLVAISTSGQSKNILNAAEMAHQKKMSVIALTGKDGGKLIEVADWSLCVPHYGYADRIQEVHIKLIHILVQAIELQWSLT